MKTCNTCGVKKPLDEFPTRRDSRRPEQGVFHIGRCRDCERARLRVSTAGAKRRAIQDAKSTFEVRRVRHGLRPAIAMGFKEHIRRVERALAGEKPPPTPRRVLTEEERRAYWRAYQRHRRRTQPARTAARRAVQRAVERGEILKPERCGRCGEEVDASFLHGHHHLGYARIHWLSVVWLCVPCHVEAEGAWGARLHGC